MDTNRSFYQSLIEVQSELRAPKNQRNDYAGYRYRSCEDILEAVKPLLVSRGLLLSLQDEIVQVGSRYYVRATASVTDGEKTVSASAYAREAEVKKGNDEAQITGAASSYARKYALNGLFCIDDVKDPDATNKGDGSPRKAQVPSAPPTPPADLDEAIDAALQAADVPSLMEIWKKYRHLQGYPDFVNAKNRRKAELQ